MNEFAHQPEGGFPADYDGGRRLRVDFITGDGLYRINAIDFADLVGEEGETEPIGGDQLVFVLPDGVESEEQFVSLDYASRTIMTFGSPAHRKKEAQ